MMRKFVWFCVFVLLLALSTHTLLPQYLDRSMNAIDPVAQRAVSDVATNLHQSLTIVDLHADPLLWSRDFNARNDYGHIDVPRLIEANVAIQILGAVTKTPRNQNYQNNAADTDNITALAVVQAWPPRTWNSLFERAIYQAEKADRFAADSDAQLRVIRSRKQLDDYLAQRQSSRQQTAVVLSIEGLHALEGQLDKLDRLYEKGYRSMGLSHFFDNELGGSAHGQSKAGLTDFGRAVVQRMSQLGIMLDLAHASPQMIDDALALSNGPIVVSHGGVKATCDGVRNLSDTHLRQIAAKGGVIGIGFWPTAVCDIRPQGIVKAIRHVVDTVGIDHVALGSDYDGAVTTGFDVTGLPQITQALLEADFSEQEIRQIMGLNTLRLLSHSLPE